MSLEIETVLAVLKSRGIDLEESDIATTDHPEVGEIEENEPSIRRRSTTSWDGAATIEAATGPAWSISP